MSKKKWLVILPVLLLILLIGVGGKIVMDKKNEAEKLQEDMIEIVQNDDAKREFELVLKNLDSKALTSEGVIHSYRIDKESVRRNPMGGINVVLIINDDKNLTIEYTLDMGNDHLEAGGISYSGELSDLLEENDNE
jgi:hypothetical protein